MSQEAESAQPQDNPSETSSASAAEQNKTWLKVAEVADLPEGRVMTVTAGHLSLALCHFEGQFGAVDNHCPHQGGPLGEGSIEKGWLRCPWHGFDYHPLTGKPPPPFNDQPACFQTQVRDGSVYVEIPVELPRQRTVSDVLAETLLNWGVKAVFGMVGHSNLGFADSLRHAEAAGKLRYFGIRHEGAAAFAASAYGKLTGELSACFAIAGPGSTNLLTGLYDAKIDRSPVLAVSGQVPSAVAGRGAFQDLNLASAFADVSSYSQTVTQGSNYAELATLACKTALVERGVGHLMLPDEVQSLPAPDTQAGSPQGRLPSLKVSPSPETISQAVAMLTQAQRPLFIVGAGARRDMAAITRLAEQLGAPVATTFKAKGQISDHHPLGCGVLGRSGTPVASWFMNESDLLVVFGASFSNHTGIAPYKAIIQVDFDPMALGRFHSVNLPVLGDVATVADILCQELSACDDQHSQKNHTEIAERWDIWRAEKASRKSDNTGHGVNSAAIFDTLTRLVEPDAVVCVDVGNNTYSFGRYFEVDRHSVLMSGYLGSIGFALPAALGAWSADTGRQIVSVSGDGGFGQYAMELTTAVKYDMDLTHILLNNHELGKISKEQRAGLFDVWQTSLHNPSFAAFAELCGAKGFSVSDRADLDTAIADALAHRGPALVDIEADVALV